jgi:hypothetical protein
VEQYTADKGLRISSCLVLSNLAQEHLLAYIVSYGDVHEIITGCEILSGSIISEIDDRSELHIFSPQHLNEIDPGRKVPGSPGYLVTAGQLFGDTEILHFLSADIEDPYGDRTCFLKRIPDIRVCMEGIWKYGQKQIMAGIDISFPDMGELPETRGSPFGLTGLP